RDLTVTGVQTCALPISSSSLAAMSDEPGREAPSDLLAARRRKLEGLRAEGIDPFPYVYPGVVPIAAIRQRHGGLDAGEETEDVRSEERRVGKECGARVS